MSSSRTTGLRGLKSPSFAAIAERAGCSTSLVYKVASGERRPNRAIKDAVEALYGVPASQVFPEDKD